MVGTDALGRPFTNAERDAFAALLRQHDFRQVCDVALRWGVKLSWTKLADGKDLVGRASVRLVRAGWDPARVTLVKAMCRLVWSEWTNVLSERETRRGSEDVYLRERKTLGLHVHRSREHQAIELEDEMRAEAERKVRMDDRVARLTARFEAAKDEVNLQWLACTLRGITSPAQIARESGCSVTALYRAADRRKRHVAHVLGEPAPVAPRRTTSLRDAAR
jgi:hypothetical protein